MHVSRLVVGTQHANKITLYRIVSDYVSSWIWISDLPLQVKNHNIKVLEVQNNFAIKFVALQLAVKYFLDKEQTNV